MTDNPDQLSKAEEQPWWLEAIDSALASEKQKTPEEQRIQDCFDAHPISKRMIEEFLHVQGDIGHPTASSALIAWFIEGASREAMTNVAAACLNSTSFSSGCWRHVQEVLAQFHPLIDRERWELLWLNVDLFNGKFTFPMIEG